MQFLSIKFMSYLILLTYCIEHTYIFIKSYLLRIIIRHNMQNINLRVITLANNSTSTFQ